MNTKKSLRQLANEENYNILEVIAHQQMLLAIKNQDPLIKLIFTHKNVQILLSYINQQHPLIPDNIPLSYKLPQAAMQILCCESQHITETIFQAQSEGNFQNLFVYLLQFLNYREHYFLVGLFSKAVGSLTKRVFSPNHKYNKILCENVFGNQTEQSHENQEKPYLFKTLNHIYSECMNELIIRWLTLKGKQSNFNNVKKDFLQLAISLMNYSENATPEGILNFGSQSLQSIIELIMLLLKSSLEPPPQRPQPTGHKNVSLMVNKNAQKQLYEMICQQKFIRAILMPIPDARIEKINLIQKVLKVMRIQNEQFFKLQQQYNNIHLSSVIQELMLSECLEWVCQNLGQISSKLEYQIIDGVQSNILTNSSTNNLNKKKLIAYLELLYEFHLMHNQMKQPLMFYYEQKQTEHVQIIVKLLRVKNNLIQSLLNKIVLIVLNKLDCPDFQTALLHEGIAKLIDEDHIREHILPWAKIILQTQVERGHIYENAEEEAKWDHMNQIITIAEEIIMGRYRYKPSNLETFYSLDKAKTYYSQFLKDSIGVEYEQKISLKKVESQKIQKEENFETQNLLQRKFSSPPVQSSSVFQSKAIEVAQIQPVKEQPQNEAETAAINVLQMDILRQGYLEYNVQNLINELE